MKQLLTALAIMSLSSAAHADVIDTFKTVCMSDLGNPAAIAKRGSAKGFKMNNLSGDAWMGFNKKIDQSLQINAFTKNSFECAVTTSDVSDPNALRKEFFSGLGLKDRKGVAKGKIGGKTYYFKHDTKGGEALVVYAK